MGMFDVYQPAGTLRCPVDGSRLEKWQGTDGPCGLFIWREGEPHPVGEEVDEECHLPADALERFTLPTSFIIYSYDCPRHRRISATCATIDGVWRVTHIMPLDDFNEAQANERPWQRMDATKERKSPSLREFVLIDLTTQMPYLPAFTREWPRERLLAWLRVWGEVYKIETPYSTPDDGWFAFRSWIGLMTPFVLSSDGHMYIPYIPGI